MSRSRRSTVANLHLTTNLFQGLREMLRQVQHDASASLMAEYSGVWSD